MPKSIRFTPNVLMHQFDQEAVLLNLNNETYYTLNGIAVRIWEILNATQSIDQTLKQMSEEYSVPSDVLNRDMDEFLNMLQKAALIEVFES